MILVDCATVGCRPTPKACWNPKGYHRRLQVTFLLPAIVVNLMAMTFWILSCFGCYA